MLENYSVRKCFFAISKMCLQEGKLIELKNVLTIPPQTTPCDDESFKKLWIRSSQTSSPSAKNDA